MFALDERLRLNGLAPVFAEEEGDRSQSGTDAKNAEPGVRMEDAPAAAAQKVGRNDPCPCGSGKKFKKCCGK
jgi:uncharacterized protein YecA (UPF0149 family)